MKIRSYLKVSILLVLFLELTLCTSGCQKIKKIFIKPLPEGVTEKSYPVKAYAYQLSLVFHTRPQELMDYFGKDLSWLKKGAGALQVDTTKLRPYTDMTEVGQSVDFNFRMLGINFPCRMISLKYKPDREMWWMMALPSDSWILLRFEIKPIPEGCALSLDVLGQPPKYLEAVMDAFKLVEAAALRADLVLTLIQAEFDPELDVEKVTAKGVRGELYETFLQGYETSVWVDAEPDEVAQWIIANLDSCNPEIKIKGDCGSYSVFAQLSEEEVRHCPAALEFGNIELDTNTFLIWRTEGKERIYRVYLQGLDRIAFFQYEVSPEGGASRVGCMVVTEIPGATSLRIMDIMMALTSIPKRMREALVNIKQGVEGVG